MLIFSIGKQDGNPVASSSYNLYVSTKASTDTTGNPFAYNGEARDSTDLDYLRARYYDSVAGTFLTEDSYQGELTDPLSQNLYSYVHNNPVNYTDPSGHFWKSIKKAASNAWNGVKKAVSNAWNTVKRVAANTWNTVKSAYNTAVNWVSNKVNQAVNWVSQQWNNATNWVGQQFNRIYHAGQQAYQSASVYAQAQYQQVQAQIQAQREQAVRNEYAQATGMKGTPKSREGQNLLRNWGAALAKTLKHVCTTAERVGQQIVKAAKKIDWKKVAIVATATVAAVAVTVATAGAAAPVIAGLVGAGGLGLTGIAATVATGVSVGAVSGAAAGGTYALTSGVLSGKDGKTILSDVGSGMLSGAASGALTGGLLGGVGGLISKVANPVVRYAADTVGETTVDTISDAVQGGNITPASIATSLAINAVSEGISSHSAKDAKAEVNLNKPKSGDVPVTKPRKDVTPVQQLALPGPTSKPLALPAPKSTPKTDFYVNPDGTAFKIEDIKKNIDPYALKMTQTVKNHASDIATKGKYKGEFNRPYVDSSGTGLLINEIINSGTPTKDKYLPNGWRWDVPGSFNGRSEGNFELVIDLDNNMITHFNFTR